jgi:N-acetyl-anhydromuramyl-L-alanine amidase AmpD
VVDSKKYILSESNYYDTNSTKKQIVIGHTYSKDMSFFNGWLKRMNGNYKKTTPYTVDIDGKIYNHYPPTKHSDYLGFEPYDLKVIPITLVNEGWLLKDILKNCYIDWVGNIYDREDGVLEKRWRNHTYWSPYSEKQFNSLVKLIKKLCKEFDIPNKVIDHNTQVSDINKFEGIVYKSNYNKNTTDLSPAFDYNKLKKMIENE